MALHILFFLAPFSFLVTQICVTTKQYILGKTLDSGNEISFEGKIAYLAFVHKPSSYSVGKSFWFLNLS